MRVRLERLAITTKRTTENVSFSDSVTFFYGPVGTGKSTIARLVNYCFGGDLERTPAIQQEFVAVQLTAYLGDYHCTCERAAIDTESVRVSWSHHDAEIGSVNAPIDAGDSAILGKDIYNLSDLLCFLCGITPIKVRKRKRDPDSPMVRLSFRDIWPYCYLDQTHLDSSFFRLEDAFRGRKSQDAMRFFTGLHSERLSQMEGELYRAIDQQQGKREAVVQIRRFMVRFDLGSELDVTEQIAQTKKEQAEAVARREKLERDRDASVHPTDGLKDKLRVMSSQIGELLTAIRDTEEAIEEQRSLRAELITSKIKADRMEQAGRLLEGVEYARCPRCASDISERVPILGSCRLCGSSESQS